MFPSQLGVWMSSPPPPSVLIAFGAAGSVPERLNGGQGTSWAAGDLVLKPADTDVGQLAWQAQVFSRITAVDFRLARPRRGGNGSFCIDGWSAAEYVPGAHESRRWPEIIEVGERFHTALEKIRRPSFLDRRSDPWAVGDRVAWGETDAHEFAQVRHLPLLASMLRPVTAPSQLIHGDLTGNVLFDGSQPPAIIDFSPFWRPAAYASAIVVADAFIWERADHRLLDAVSHIDDFGQYLLRALIFRGVTDWIFNRDKPRDPVASGDDPWARTVQLACQLAGNRRL